MKKLYTLLSSLCLALASTFALNAQEESRERMVVYQKNGTPVGFWVNKTESVKFLTDAPDLNMTLAVSDPAEPKAGARRLVFDFGVDVKLAKVTFVEQFRFRGGIENMTQDQLQQVFAQSQVHDIVPSGPKMEFDLTGLQQGYKYYALFFGKDEFGCAGEIKYVAFDIPEAKQKGNPSMDVKFEAGASSVKIKFTPNSDVKGYYFLVGPTEDPSMESVMKMMGIPDLKHYVEAFGTDFYTNPRTYHKGAKETEVKGLSSGVEHTLYLLLMDQDGQLGDVIVTNKFTTKTLGTELKANIEISVVEATSNGVSILCKPDENTHSYRVCIAEKAKYNKAEVEKLLKEAPEMDPNFPFFSEQQKVSTGGLTPETEYLAIAMPRNAKKEWGDIVTVDFKTTAAATTTPAPQAKAINGLIPLQRDLASNSTEESAAKVMLQLSK